MAPKRLKEDPPPAADSSDEEPENDAVSEEEEEEEENDVVEQKSDDEEDEEGDDDDDEEEDSEEEKLALTPPPPSSKVSKPVSESASGSDSETEISQASPSASDFTIKPITSKPMDDDDVDVDVPPKPKKPNPTNGPNKPTSAPIKRAAAEIDPNPKDSKKKKPSTTTTNGDDEDPKKSSGVQRLWGEDDEIAVLKGMIDYQTKKGSDPYSEMAAFHEFIKKSLRVEVSKNQLMDKVRRLRKKYQTNADKSGENGADPVFNKPHDHKSFELSKKIWGIDNNNNNANASVNNRKAARLAGKPNNNWSLTLALPAKKEELSNGEVKNAVKVEAKNAAKNVVKNEEKNVVKNEGKEFWESYPCLKASLEATESASGLGSWYVKEEVVPTIGNAKAKELERKWREMGEKQMELYVNKMELIYEQAKLMLEAMKKMA